MKMRAVFALAMGISLTGMAAAEFFNDVKIPMRAFGHRLQFGRRKGDAR